MTRCPVCGVDHNGSANAHRYGRHLHGRERDVNRTRPRPDRRYVVRTETMSGWEARIAHEARERTERNETILIGIVIAVLVFLVVGLILTTGAVPR